MSMALASGRQWQVEVARSQYVKDIYFCTSVASSGGKVSSCHQQDQVAIFVRVSGKVSSH